MIEQAALPIEPESEPIKAKRLRDYSPDTKEKNKVRRNAQRRSENADFQEKLLNGSLSVTEVERYNNRKTIEAKANKKFKDSGKKQFRSPQSIENNLKRISEKRKIDNADNVLVVGRIDPQRKTRNAVDAAQQVKVNERRNIQRKVIALHCLIHCLLHPVSLINHSMKWFSFMYSISFINHSISCFAFIHYLALHLFIALFHFISFICIQCLACFAFIYSFIHSISIPSNYQSFDTLLCIHSLNLFHSTIMHSMYSFVKFNLNK